MKTHVTIISIWSKEDSGTIPERRSNRVYTVEVERGLTWAETLERAFGVTNLDSRPFGQLVCSSTCGDIFILDGDHYFCDSHSFRRITQEQSFKIQQLSSRDTGFGWKWLEENGLI